MELITQSGVIRSECTRRKLLNKLMNINEAKQAFDGLMLSPTSSIQFREGEKDAYFHSVISDKPSHPVQFDARVSWVKKEYAAVFKALGITTKKGYPRMEQQGGRTDDGRVVRGFVIETGPSSFLTEQYARWYKTEAEEVVQAG